MSMIFKSRCTESGQIFGRLASVLNLESVEFQVNCYIRAMDSANFRHSSELSF